MKRLILFLFLLCGSLQAKDVGVDITGYSTAGVTNTIAAGATTVILILSDIANGPAIVQLATQPGSISFQNITTNELALTWEAPQGDTLSEIRFRIVSGGVRVVRLQ